MQGQTGDAGLPDLLQLGLHFLLCPPQDVKVAGTFQEIVGIRKKQSFGTFGIQPQPLQDAGVRPAGRIVPQAGVLVEFGPELAEGESFGNHHHVLAVLAFLELVEPVGHRQRFDHAIVTGLEFTGIAGQPHQQLEQPARADGVGIGQLVGNG